MTTTTRTRLQIAEAGTEAVRWRTWPLVDNRPWSWLAPIGLLLVGAFVWILGGGWILTVAAVVGLAATLWQFFLPVRFEIISLGVRREALGRSRLVPWHAIRAYQLRPTGVVLYQRIDPTKIDLVRSMFVPYPADADEMLCALREHLSHAVELS